jgi:DNA polymerase-3 subunit epsilon
MHPGKRNSLDALCDRYGVSNAHRALHGALLDAELLAEVYLAMTRGQNSLTIDLTIEESASDNGDSGLAAPIADIIVQQATADELAEHETVMKSLDKEVKGSCLWRAAVSN